VPVYELPSFSLSRIEPVSATPSGVRTAVTSMMAAAGSEKAGGSMFPVTSNVSGVKKLLQRTASETTY
jgi:hypothetical protein